MKKRSTHRHGHRHEYQADDAEMRVGWRLLVALANSGNAPELPKDIASATGLPRGLALRLWVIRECGESRAIALWTDDRIVTVGMLERALRWAPYDERAQLRELSEVCGEARARLAQEKKEAATG